MQKNNLPAWFNGSQYIKGDTVKNPFSGEEYELNATELSMYDFIVGSQMVMEMTPKMMTPSTPMIKIGFKLFLSSLIVSLLITIFL